VPEQPPASEEATKKSTDVVHILGLEDAGRVDRLAFKRPAEWRLGRAEIATEEFRKQVKAFLDTMREVFANLPDTSDGFRLDQVTIAAEISAKGKISLLGSGGELAGKAGLTFTFTRGAATIESPQTPDGLTPD
jgi:hypothetical protein